MRKKFNFLHKVNYLLLLITVVIAASYLTYGQTSWSQEASQGGFWLKKVVSDTAIATGQPFSYTIYYSIPAGATNVTISDNLPSGLMFLSASYNNACGTPTVVSPTVNQMGGTYSLTWASVPNACAGSFTIQVSFPNGVTCPNDSVINIACLTGTLSGKVYEFCTRGVTTKAVAINPWHINKYPLGAAWQGGNCSYASGSDTITYQLCVYKDFGTTGQLNLVGGIVKDTLPTGAMLVSSTCGATQSGNVITWNIGNLSATQGYNSVCCQIKVYYPPAQFPTGSNITNSATLIGGLGPVNQPCKNFSITSNQTCVSLVSFTTGSLSKWIYTNRQPGCAGQYLIYACNTGTTQLSVTIKDTLPTQLSGYSLGYNNLNATLSGNIVTALYTLAPGACGYIYVNFTIPTNATIGSTITNCVHMTAQGLNPLSYCASFVVDAPAPTPCLWKEVCNKQSSYTPGSIFRYRLRIQNIGGLPLTGSSITDQLNPNLEYVGNPSYYQSNTWNTPCTTTPSNPWNGVNISYNAGSNIVTATLPSIPAVCQNIFYAACGMYGTGGVPYYFIEFDVKVRDTSALGNIPNSFTLSGGNLGNSTYTSNTENVLVAGVVGYNLNKGVKKHNNPNYGSSVNVSAGGVVDYKLLMNSTGTAALRYVTFADLLPKDAGAADSKILQTCSSRGSQFDVTYNNFITSSPTVTQWSNPFNTGLANVNNLQPIGSPGFAFSIGCGSGGTWAANWSTGDKNLAAHFGSNSISTSASVEFSGLVSNNAKPQETACNSFAASGFTKHLIQSNLTSFQLAGQTESSPVCLTIDSTSSQSHCIDSLIRFDVKCKEQGANGNWVYSMVLTATSCVPGTISLTSPDGNFSPSSFNITSNPWTINTNFIHTNSNNPIKIYYTIACNNDRCTDSIMRDLPTCDSSTHCIEKLISKSVKCIGTNAAGNTEFAIQIQATSCTPATLLISSPDGNFSTSSFSLTSSPWTINTTFEHTNANNPIKIYYTLLCNGVVCRDSMKLDLPDCPQPNPDDCCLKFIHIIKEPKITWTSNGLVGLSGFIYAGPSKIKKFSATIVSAQLRKYNTSWQRIFGDIIGGSLVIAPAPGPQLLSLYSREAIWGPGECIDWNQGAQYSLSMIFPSVAALKYYDTLKFSIRYSFTDCECKTCDTLISYTIIRKWKPLPWDVSSSLNPKGIKSKKSGNSDVIQSDMPSQTSLIMDDYSNGNLWIVNPQDPENDIKIVGVEINSKEVVLNSLKYDNKDGIIQGNVGYIDVLVKRGDIAKIALSFDNNNQLKQFTLYARYFYQIEGFTDIFTTEPIIYNARVPITDLDKIGIDESSRPVKVFTYALYVNNTNGYGETISAISIKPIGNEKIIAVGPPSTFNGTTYLMPQILEDGTYIVTVPSQGIVGVEPGANVKPIFITLSGIDEANSQVEFVTFDNAMQKISTGNLTLTNPISSIQQSEIGSGSSGYLDLISPNPANTSATISFTLNNFAENVKLSIVDMQGREVAILLNNKPLDRGVYLQNLDISKYASGNYLVNLQINNELITKNLLIVR